MYRSTVKPWGIYVWQYRFSSLLTLNSEQMEWMVNSWQQRWCGRSKCTLVCMNRVQCLSGINKVSFFQLLFSVRQWMATLTGLLFMWVTKKDDCFHMPSPSDHQLINLCQCHYICLCIFSKHNILWEKWKKQTRNNICVRMCVFVCLKYLNKPGFVGLWVVRQRGLAQGNFGKI